MNEFDPIQATLRQNAIHDGYIVPIQICGVPVEAAIKQVPNGPWFFHLRIGECGDEHMIFASDSRSLVKSAVPNVKAFLEEFAAAVRAQP